MSFIYTNYKKNRKHNIQGYNTSFQKEQKKTVWFGSLSRRNKRMKISLKLKSS